MPELRNGRRRRRAPVRSSEPVAKYVKTRAAVAAAKKQEQEKKPVTVISEPEERDKKKDRGEIEGIEMGDDTGGLSANKGVPQEDEGNTTPFPERVFHSPIFTFFVFCFVLFCCACCPFN